MGQWWHQACCPSYVELELDVYIFVHSQRNKQLSWCFARRQLQLFVLPGHRLHASMAYMGLAAFEH